MLKVSSIAPRLSMLAATVAVFTACISASAEAAVIIKPTAATASSTTAFDPRTITKSIDGSGLTSPLNTGDTVPATYPASGATGDDNYLSLANDYTPVLTFDLGSAYDLTSFHLWNYSEGFYAGNLRGIKTANVLVSSDNVSFTQVGGTYTFALSTNNANYAGEDYSLIAANTRYVRIDALTNGGNNTGNDFSNATGISEIRFVGDAVAVPEPTGALAVVGGLGIASLLRRRKLA